MVRVYVSKIMSACLYAALFFILLGFAVMVMNGRGAPITEISFMPVLKSFAAGNSNAFFLVAAFIVCLAPFLSVLVLIRDSFKNKNIRLISVSVVLVILLIVSLFFE